jgi:glutathione synthase/RimK-type ligase-like ATP-grasp enzyme
MPRIALATCRDLPELDLDSAGLLPVLARRSVEAVPCIWDDEAVDWVSFELTVLRSTWDYHQAPTRFTAWLREVAHLGRLINPLHVIEWNIDKRYLRTLSERGLPIVPTAWVLPEQALDLAGLAALAAQWSVGELIVKPCISAGSADTWRLALAQTPSVPAELATLLANRPCMVQPFVPSIESVGELSLIFLAGGYSHAVRKRPVPGDFRSQEEWGARIEAELPPQDLIDLAAACLREVPGQVLFARVDFMFDEAGTPMVGEVEVIEPGLYMAYAPGSADRLADALLGLLCRGASPQLGAGAQS